MALSNNELLVFAHIDNYYIKNNNQFSFEKLCESLEMTKEVAKYNLLLLEEKKFIKLNFLKSKNSSLCLVKFHNVGGCEEYYIDTPFICYPLLKRS